MSTMRTGTMKWMLVAAVTTLLLGACNPSASLAADSAATARRAAELAQGTMSLEGTDQAVGVEAAAQLLPLWELLSDLCASSTAAPEEITATVVAIEAAMTPGQLAAIDAMDLSLTGVESAEAIPSRALASAGASGGATVQVETVAMDPALGGDPSAAMGAMPMDGGMPPGGFQQRQGNTAPIGASPSGMYREVIALLQGKTQT